MNELPNMPKDLPCFVVRKRNQTTSVNDYKEFKVNRADIIAWLRFLHKNNRYYHDIDIDAAIRRCNEILPENDSIASSLNSIEENDLERVILDAKSQSDNEHEENIVEGNSKKTTDAVRDADDADDVDDEGDGINRPETGGASGDDTPPSVSNEYLQLPINATSKETEEHENLLRNLRNAGGRPGNNEPTRVDWPAEGQILNDLTEPGILARAFPTLFPYAKGDPTIKDRPHEVKMFMAARHFLKYAVNLKEAKEHLLSNYPLTEEQKVTAKSLWKEGDHEFVYPFVESDRFIHWIQNTCERHRAIGQRSFWLNKNSDYANLSTEEMSTLIREGGEEYRNMLSSMQTYNSNISGSDQYLRQKRKLLDGLCEQKVRAELFKRLKPSLSSSY